MKKTIFFLFTFVSVVAYSQLPKKFLPVASQYFISLPYNLQFSDWLDSVRNNPVVKTDSLFSLDSLRNVFFYGHLINHSTAFPKSDSIGLQIGATWGRLFKKVNGSVVDENKQVNFYLRHIFYFPKDSLSKEEWNALIKSTTKAFKKFFDVNYPISSAKTKDEMVWFRNPGDFAPVIQMRYGESQKRNDSYFIWLELDFSIIPSEQN